MNDDASLTRYLGRSLPFHKLSFQATKLYATEYDVSYKIIAADDPVVIYFDFIALLPPCVNVLSQSLRNQC